MKKFIFIFIFLASMSSQAQTNLKFDKRLIGIFGRISSIEQTKRLTNYPFNKATQIQLVSFNGNGGQRIGTALIKDGMPKLTLEICIKPFEETISLTASQIDQLTDLFYNFGYIKLPFVEDLAKCYEPRNGILFLNEKGEVFEFIEICFDCSKTVFSSNKIVLKQKFNAKKLEALKKYFQKVGIEFGVTKKFLGQ